MARYKLGGLVLHHTANWKFPASTFFVNVLGCLIAGLLVGLVERYGSFSREIRLLLFTGLLGGFTTFSAFGVDTIYLLQRHELWWAGLNVVLSVVVGLSALWIGVTVIR